MPHLGPQDEVKFVLCDRTDYDWAVFKVTEHALGDRVGEVLFSPSHGQLDPAMLAEWILSDRLAVRMQMQMHKTIWGNEPGR